MSILNSARLHYINKNNIPITNLNCTLADFSYCLVFVTIFKFRVLWGWGVGVYQCCQFNTNATHSHNASKWFITINISQNVCTAGIRLPANYLPRLYIVTLLTLHLKVSSIVLIMWRIGKLLSEHLRVINITTLKTHWMNIPRYMVARSCFASKQKQWCLWMRMMWLSGYSPLTLWVCDLADTYTKTGIWWLPLINSGCGRHWHQHIIGAPVERVPTTTKSNLIGLRVVMLLVCFIYNVYDCFLCGAL